MEQNQYIADCEQYNEAGEICGWVNMSVGTDNKDANALSVLIRDKVALYRGCEPNAIRIVGLFKL